MEQSSHQLQPGHVQNVHMQQRQEELQEETEGQDEEEHIFCFLFTAD